MPPASSPAGIRVGLMPSPQFTTWEQLEAVAVLADQAGIDELWMPDHLLAPYGREDGDVFEAFTTLAAWAAVTRRATLGTMVSANRFRAPTLLAKMITGIDHISGGRAILGLGAGWFEREHRAFGFPFGTIGERLDALEAALPVVRSMLHGEPAGVPGAPPNRPAPLQRHLPLLVGASGERRGLRLVAEHADVWNTPGPLDVVTAKLEALHRWCEVVQRDPAEIALSYHLGPVLIRDDLAEARAVLDAQAVAHRRGAVQPARRAARGRQRRPAGLRGPRLPQLLRRRHRALRRGDHPPAGGRGRPVARQRVRPDHVLLEEEFS